MSKKLALFPMTKDMCAVARYSSLLQGYTLTYLFAPGFMGLGGSDINVIDGGTPTGMLLTDYSYNMLAMCHTLFVDYDENIKNLSVYSEVIESAIALGVTVIRSRKLALVLEKMPIARPGGEPLRESPETDCLYEIRVPIITVLSHGVRSDQFAIELALRKHFVDQGYTVSQIGSFEASKLFGFPGMPDFLFEPFDMYEKVIKFNRYAKDLTENENTDLLIIGVPGGIMKYNNRYLNGLGLLPFTVCNAVVSDLVILSVYHKMYNKIFFDELMKYGQYHLGTAMQFFNISNTGFIPAGDNEMFKTKYINLTSDFTLGSMQDIQSEDFHLFNVLDSASANRACTAVLDALADNIGYVK